MIFRRIKAHIAKEDWFAVFIDFIIVVFGVFMGFQVNNWNVARDERSLDQRYMVRLHDEIRTGDAANTVIADELNTTIEYLTETISVLSNLDAEDTLTRNLCDAVFASHIYRPGRVSIPTMDELIASGRASVISDDPLRRAILQLSQRRQATDDFNARISGDAVELHRKYPELIKLNRELTYDRFGFAPYGGHTCNAESMRENLGFMNDLTDNLYRMDSYVKLTHSLELAVFDEIHTSLDRILKIDHKEEPTP